MMNNNLTTKFMEGLQASQKAAQSAGRAQIYPAELLLALVQQVMEREDLKYCPHGRPICVSLSKKQLEKQFKRS